MSGFSVSLPPRRFQPAAGLPTPPQGVAPAQRPAQSPAQPPAQSPAATSGVALATGYAPPAPGRATETRAETLAETLAETRAETRAEPPAGTARTTDRGRAPDRLRDPALAGPPPAFQTNLLDLRNDLETLVRDMNAARVAEARILYGAAPPPRPHDPPDLAGLPGTTAPDS